VLDLLASKVRSELIVLPAAFALAAVVLWIVGPHGQRLRRNWRAFEYAGSVLLTIGALIVLNQLASPHAHEWAVVSGNWKGRLWSLGMQATEAFALGLGLLPFVGGLASLWMPERRSDPNWRAFAAFLGSATFTVWMYTGVKAAYLSTVFATRVEERNLIYLGPLFIVGAAVWLASNHKWLPGALAALAFTAWLVIHYGYQLDYPYFEAPGYGIATMANRAWHWNQPTIRVGLVVACLVLLAFVLSWSARVPARVQRVTIVLATALALTWMLAGEITSSRGSAVTSKSYVAPLPKPLDWVDQATQRKGTTFIGQSISSGDALGVNLLEFWNRSVKNIWSLDGSAPGPGPTLTPDLSDRYGTLSHDPGLPYVLATDGVNLIGPVVASSTGLTLRLIQHHPWRLHDAEYGVSGDGWISGSKDIPFADGTYAYFGPETKPGTLSISVGRKGFCATGAPGTRVTVQVGSVALNEQKAPYVAHASWVKKFLLHNCEQKVLTVTVAPPLAVHVHASSTVQPIDYGATDPRMLGAQVGFSFKP
jgi:hypothetical protein